MGEFQPATVELANKGETMQTSLISCLQHQMAQQEELTNLLLYEQGGLLEWEEDFREEVEATQRQK